MPSIQLSTNLAYWRTVICPVVRSLGNSQSPFLLAGLVSHFPSRRRVRALSSNRTARPVFRCWIDVRVRISPDGNSTSPHRNPIRSQPRSLLSIASSNSTRSRSRARAFRRRRTARTSLSLSAGFWPIRRPLFHGTRGTGFLRPVGLVPVILPGMDKTRKSVSPRMTSPDFPAATRRGRLFDSLLPDQAFDWW